MIRIEFSEQELEKIERLRYEHSHPRVRRRMEVLWLKSQGLAHQDICRLAGVSSNTLRKYLRMFQTGGIPKVMALNFYAPTSDLEPHRFRLATYFREHPPATLNEAAAKIQELTEIKRSPSAVGRFLNSLGMAPRRVGTMPSKADPDKQEHFLINELEPRLEEAKQGKRAIFLSMLLTLSWVPFSVCCGRSPAYSSRPLPGGGASTCWGR
jgi:transposase